MRKEPIVFLVVLAFAGWQAKGLLSSDGGRGVRRSGSERDLELAAVPDVDAALPSDGRGALFERNLFEPPSPTRPLPPLEVVRPRIGALPALSPPSPFGPAAPAYGALLREPEAPAEGASLPGLFDRLAEGAFEAPPPAAALGATDDVDPEGTGKLSKDPEERAAQVLAFKQQYDWVYRSSLMFGRIQNEDRYRMALAGEIPDGQTLRFVELDPFTGAPRYVNTELELEFTNDEIREFGLADTPLTRVEVGLVSFEDPLPPTRFTAAVVFANECLGLRNDTPRALEVAEELFQRAQAINTQDSIEPRLGLARCYELGFQLDRAYGVYDELIAGGFAQNALVHARLGALQAVLRLDGDARGSFEEAVRLDAGSWEVRWRFGRFLGQRGLWEDALVHLSAAVQREPRGPESRRARVELRLERARALLQLGRSDDAYDAAMRCMAADPEGEEGLGDLQAACLLSASLFSGRPGASAVLSVAASGPVTRSDFDAKLALGLAALRAGAYEKAAALLLDARADDPFRAWEADRALSRLAEATDNPEEADAFITAALAGSPRDAWSLFQAGRLARAGGDDARARAAYQAALEVELDFAPAMARLAELLEEAGDLASAERYYERLAMLEPDNAALWARRGWNALSLGDVDLARTSFDRARDIDLGSESARAGLAWWHYATGEPGEALTLFGEIVDDARSEDREGPWSTFAETESARILDHESKEVFRDRFDRADGRIANGWTEDKGVGPLSDLSKGAVRIEGSHQKSGRTRVFRQLPPDRFIAFTAALTVGDDARGTRSGLFVASERTSRRGEVEVRAELAVCRNRDGEIEVRIQKKSTDGDAAFRAVSGPEWPQGKAVRVSIERRGEDLDSRFTLLVDGEPVETDLQIDALFSSRQNLSFGAFVEGEPGRVADLVVDDVRVVRRK